MIPRFTRRTAVPDPGLQAATPAAGRPYNHCGRDVQCPVVGQPCPCGLEVRAELNAAQEAVTS